MRVMPTLRPTSPSRYAAGVGVEFDIVFSIPDCDWSGLIRQGNGLPYSYLLLWQTPGPKFNFNSKFNLLWTWRSQAGTSNSGTSKSARLPFGKPKWQALHYSMARATNAMTAAGKDCGHCICATPALPT
jgi:hypothetical protein